MVREGQSQDRLAYLGVSEAHAAWEPRVLVHDEPPRPHGLELRVATTEQGREPLGRQGDESERTIHCVTSGVWATVPPSHPMESLATR